MRLIDDVYLYNMFMTNLMIVCVHVTYCVSPIKIFGININGKGYHSLNGRYRPSRVSYTER